jgi:hypothetical protein
MYTRILDNRPWKNPGEKTSATDLDFIIVAAENMEISYKSIRSSL